MNDDDFKFDLVQSIIDGAQRLHTLIELDAPAYIIETEKRLLQRRVVALPVYMEGYVPHSYEGLKDDE